MIDHETAVVLAETWDESDDEDAEGNAVITMFNVETGEHKTLYSAAGGPSGESTIAVSPDARHIAATYTADAPPDDPYEYYSHTVVVNLHGRLLLHLHRAQMVPMGNTGWLSPSQVTCELYGPDGMPEPDLAAIDVFSGERHPLRSSWRRPTARLGDRFLFQSVTSTSEGPALETVALQGDDWRPFLASRNPT